MIRDYYPYHRLVSPEVPHGNLDPSCFTSFVFYTSGQCLISETRPVETRLDPPVEGYAFVRYDIGLWAYRHQPRQEDIAFALPQATDDSDLNHMERLVWSESNIKWKGVQKHRVVRPGPAWLAASTAIVSPIGVRNYFRMRTQHCKALIEIVPGREPHPALFRMYKTAQELDYATLKLNEDRIKTHPNPMIQDMAMGVLYGGQSFEKMQKALRFENNRRK